MNSSSEISIRSAQEKDAGTIAEIHVASWQKIYRSHIPDPVLDNLSISEREQQWSTLINNKLSIWLIISAIYLNPNVWRQGLDKKLCSKALAELKNMGFSEAFFGYYKKTG